MRRCRCGHITNLMAFAPWCAYPSIVHTESGCGAFSLLTAHALNIYGTIRLTVTWIDGSTTVIGE